MNEEILNWLSSKQNYSEGIILLQKYGKNKHLLRVIQKNPKRYHGKLVAELKKLVNHQKVVVNTATTPVKKINTLVKKITIEAPVESNGYYAEDISHYPKEIRRVITQFRQLYVKRAQLHRQMGDIPSANNPQNNLARKKLSDEIKTISEKMDSLWAIREEFDKTKKLPDPSVTPSEEKGIPTVNKVSGAVLVFRKKNLESSLTKDRNFLIYQQKTKGNKENPMPPGPKRESLLKRIKEKEEELKIINQKLHADKD
jgi:hypothetical protein